MAQAGFKLTMVKDDLKPLILLSHPGARVSGTLHHTQFLNATFLTEQHQAYLRQEIVGCLGSSSYGKHAFDMCWF